MTVITIRTATTTAPPRQRVDDDNNRTFPDVAAPPHGSPEGLRKISASIPKVFILTGDADMLADPSGGHFFKSVITEAEFHRFENAGPAVA